jgi:hypothetical protein
MAEKKKSNRKDEEKRITELNEEENPKMEIPDTGAVHADPDVLTPDEKKDNVDIEIVLENMSPDEVAREVSQFTDDEDVQEDFADRQQLNTGGGSLLGKLEQYNQVSPDLSAGDIDAAWESVNENGDEGLSGTNPTPDQDVVDYEGLAAGLDYGLEEELDSDKINERDRHRWELDPESVDDQNLAEDVRNLEIDIEEDQGDEDDEE